MVKAEQEISVSNLKKIVIVFVTENIYVRADLILSK